MKQTKEEILKKYILLGQSELDSEKDNEFDGEDYKNAEKYLCRAMEEYATQCQQDMADKKYTEEDLENAFNSGRGHGVPDNIKDFNSFINSLNKQD